MFENGTGGTENTIGGTENTIGGTADVSENTADGIRTVDPSSGVVKRGRGRPAGSGAKSSGSGKQPASARREKTTPAAINGIEKILFSMHQMAAAFIAPELELADGEAKDLTAALGEVSNFYNQVVDPKIIAWMGLIGVAGKIYGPRVGAFMLRRQFEKGAKPAVNPTQKPQQSAPLSKSLIDAFIDPSFVSTPSE